MKGILHVKTDGINSLEQRSKLPQMSEFCYVIGEIRPNNKDKEKKITYTAITDNASVFELKQKTALG